ncbi:hypothetical protein DFH09DRAFT_1370027 [Mycena vulgaris]|nr:hypothetical protein DFH09DRAFT_1370027 [Mycena vulgaris]
MHRALQIPELVDVVCSHVAPLQPSSEPGLRDLAVLARTSKIFHNAALDGLWSYQATFANILRCMPNDLWDGPVLASSVDRLGVVRPIEPGDWERPLFYLSRVRTLQLFFSEELPSEELFETLTLCLPGDHLFPHLNFLAWPYLERRLFRLFPYIRILLGPQITRLEMNIPAIMPYLSLVPTIAVKCPALTHAQICCEAPRELVPLRRRSASLFVCSSARLENLRIDDLDHSAFEHLAVLPTLKSLTLDYMDYLHRPRSPSQFYDTPRFVALDRLKVWPRTAEVATAFIATLSGSRVAHVYVDILGPPTVAAISSLYESVADNLPHETLRSVHISSDDVGVLPASPEQPVEAAVLRRLRCFPNLTDISLNFRTGFDLDDATVLELARAWPNLRSLALVPSFPSLAPRDVALVTFTGLRAFADHCPELISLGIELNTGVIPCMETDAIPQTKCRSLYVGYAPITDPVAVANFVFSMFPEVSEIHASKEDPLTRTGH